MIQTQHGIAGQVQQAKDDPEAADALVRQYMGFIRAETVKWIHTAPENGHEDELSVALLAFYEAVLAYKEGRGAFLPFAARAIRNRLIDYYRAERRRGTVISLHAPVGEEGGQELGDLIPDPKDEIEEYSERQAGRQEIVEFGAKLAQFGLSFSDVADNCPRQERTLAACHRVLDFARSQPQLLRRIEESGRLPPVPNMPYAADLIERRKEWLTVITFQDIFKSNFLERLGLGLQSGLWHLCPGDERSHSGSQSAD